MKLFCVLVDNHRRIALEKDDAFLDVTEFLPRKRADLKAFIERGPAAWKRFAARVAREAGALNKLHRKALRILAPYRNPEKIICVGLNYMDHIREQGGTKPVPQKPVLFSKLTSAIVGPGDPIVHPRATGELDYEGELAVIIGRTGKHISEQKALDHVFGYSIMNDVSARDLQRTEAHWVRAKGGDTFGPFGPCIVTADEIPDPQALAIRTLLNGEAVQDSTTSEMIFSVRKLIAFASEVATLFPGDVISTGTPAGVGVWRKPPRLLKPGDRVQIEIEKIGALENPVVAESDAG
jgi:2-keto-4-pentenoate hydratase/2-oxohepta-3-ene-1,7-dioic acid hydratase in catechol pathway